MSESAVKQTLKLIYEMAKDAGLDPSTVDVEYRSEDRFRVLIWYWRGIDLLKMEFPSILEAVRFFEKRKGPLWRKFS